MAENKREQVKALIETGEYTKKEIAEKLDMKESGVSSQLTYLRWMGNFIIFGEDKKLSFTDEAGYIAWEEAKKANRKNPVSKKSPEDQAAALEKTVANQTKKLANFQEKADLLEASEEPVDQDMIDEVDANITLLDIKLRRNQTKLDELKSILTDEATDEYVEDAEDTEDVADEDTEDVEDDELL